MSTGADWVCAACGDVVGAYEPMVLVGSDGERVSARTVEQLDGDERVYHEACWELADEDAG